MNPNFMPFAKAREFVRAFGFSTAADFRTWTTGTRPDLPEKPADLPSNPHQVYLGEFLGYADFLGSSNKAPYRREFLPFEEARAFVRELGLESLAEWKRYCAGEIPELGVRPENIPSNPNFTYRGKGWAGSRDWLGTGGPQMPRGSDMVPLDEARKFARRLQLSSWTEWRKYVRGELRHLPAKPHNVPAIPHACYRAKGWVSYGDFLGSDTVAWHSTDWRSYEDAKAFVSALNLRSQQEWRRWHREIAPKDIPYNPDKAYAQAWEGWSVWLGKYQRTRTTESARDWIAARLR
ncbi:hypothetical protein DB347_17965 [Opitutaceae bacterium EW11]|nr:hypothetical protein DB347_17965 [Opitutaceae bacterium EW11]